MTTTKVPHQLGLQGARERLQGLFRDKQIECEWDGDGLGGLVSKRLPLVGVAQARMNLTPDAVEVQLTKAPAFPSAETIQRLIVDELTRALK